jgi:hypothetical protein
MTPRGWEADREDAVVELDAALLGWQNPTAVKLKRLLVRLNAHRHRLRSARRVLEGLRGEA